MDPEQSDQEKRLAQNILTLRANDIQPTHFVSLQKPRHFFRERFDKFWNYRWEINELFDRLFPGMLTAVMYHYSSGFPGYVFIKKPNEQNPYYVLFTAGMSHVPMKIPKSLRDRRVSLERAELLMFLSPKFSLKGLMDEDSAFQLAHLIPWNDNWLVKLEKRHERIRLGGYPNENLLWNYPELWPIAWLGKMARLPYKNRTWIRNGLVVRDVGPINTWKAGGIFLKFGDLAARNGQQINLYGCVTLYPDEIEYLHPQYRETTEQERREAYERILKDLPLIVDLKRPSLCPKDPQVPSLPEEAMREHEHNMRDRDQPSSHGDCGHNSVRTDHEEPMQEHEHNMKDKGNRVPMMAIIKAVGILMIDVGYIVFIIAVAIGAVVAVSKRIQCEVKDVRYETGVQRKIK